eukprot:5597841-Amphidinium_carterae.1
MVGKMIFIGIFCNSPAAQNAQHQQFTGFPACIFECTIFGASPGSGFSIDHLSYCLYERLPGARSTQLRTNCSTCCRGWASTMWTTCSYELKRFVVHKSRKDFPHEAHVIPFT